MATKFRDLVIFASELKSSRDGMTKKEMLKRGIYLAPSPFEAGFTSLAHSEEEIDKTIEAFDESFNAIKK